MTINNFDSLVYNFQMSHAWIAERAENYKQTGVHELLIQLNNGEKLIYDEIAETIRFISHTDIGEDEEAWRVAFSKALRSRMGWRGMHSIELSEKTGISKISISNYLMGKTTPSAYNIRKMANVLDCDPDELVSFDFYSYD